MKILVKYFLAVCLGGIILSLILNFLFPFVYKIKEPYFAMPLPIVETSLESHRDPEQILKKKTSFGIKLDKKAKSIEDLSIRHDSYGDGEFGAKRKNKRIHKGLDMEAAIKSPVYASKSGWARSHFVPGGYGNLVTIDHPGGWQTRYGHLYKPAAEKSTIKKFQWVRQGDIIGLVGKSGNANTKRIISHLHFEIRYKDEPLDPAGFLVKSNG